MHSLQRHEGSSQWRRPPRRGLRAIVFAGALGLALAVVPSAASTTPTPPEPTSSEAATRAPGWRWVAGWPAERSSPMVWDSQRQVIVMHGGPYVADTWEYNGRRWSPVKTSTQPPYGFGFLTYDASRGVTVMLRHVGETWQHLGTDTWEYDGRDWQRVSTAHEPPDYGPMVYDSERGVIVAFSGNRELGYVETWEYDGTDWGQVTTADMPSGRSDATIAYDAGRGVTVLWGGSSYGGFEPLDDTWEYDGTDWRQVTTAQRPPATYGHSMAYDPDRAVTVVYGVLPTGFDTWEYDGTTWRQVTTAQHPPADFNGGLAYDEARNRMVHFGGLESSFNNGDETWYYDGTDWLRAPMAGATEPRDGHDMVYDSARGLVVAFGGIGDAELVNRQEGETLELVGDRWRKIGTPVSPPARTHTALAYDRERGVVVLHGGMTAQESEPLEDTWLYDGATWREVSTAVHPNPQQGHGMAFDERRGVTVLHGGFGADETWEFDGSGWVQRKLAVHPPDGATRLAWDPVREQIIATIFGEGPEGGWQTWTYDGSAWTKVLVATPVADELAYDPDRDVFVAKSGCGEEHTQGGRKTSFIAEFDPATETWTRTGTRAIVTCTTAQLAYDEANSRMVHFAGQFVSHIGAGITHNHTYAYSNVP